MFEFSLLPQALTEKQCSDCEGHDEAIKWSIRRIVGMTCEVLVLSYLTVPASTLTVFCTLLHVHIPLSLYVPIQKKRKKKKFPHAVYLTHTLCTLKAQLYFLWSLWHPPYFRCPCCHCRVCVFIVLHHFRGHLLDLLQWHVIVGFVWFLLQSFHLGLLHRGQSR